MNEMTAQNDELDEESRDLLEIEKLSEDVDQLAENALEKALRIGELLSKYRKGFPRNGLRNGQRWEQWVEIHTPFGPRRARKYMEIYQFRSAGYGRTKLEAQWKLIQNGPSEERRKRAAQRRAQQDLEQETEHGITDAAACRFCNTLWDKLSANQSEKGKVQIAKVMIAFLVDAYHIDLDDLPEVRIRR
jgi:hypothetical protein